MSGEKDLSLRAMVEEERKGVARALSLISAAVHYVIPPPTRLSTMAKDILDPAAVLAQVPKLLPPSAKFLASPQDALAALVHAALSVLAFRLIAVDESSTSPAPSDNVLPESWNKSGPGHYTFKYRHDQSSLEFVIKVSKLGTRTVINAIALEVST